MPAAGGNGHDIAQTGWHIRFTYILPSPCKNSATVRFQNQN